MSTDHTFNPAVRATQLASLAAIVAVVVGSLVLVGWAADIVALKSILPGWVSMKPNAAACFILIGVALLLTTRQSSISNPHSAALFFLLGRLCGLLAGLIGLLTLGEYIFGWNPGIDQWLIREPAGTVGTSHPIRMAPEAALNFVFLSVALWVTGSSRKTRSIIRARWPLLVSASLSLLVMVIALAAMLSYATLDLGAYGWFGLTIMAMHAALLFAMLGVAVIVINWQQDGLQWSLSRKATAAIACGMALLVFIGFTTNRSQFWMKETSYKIAHTEKIQGDIGNILTEVVDAQVHARDYALTGDEQFLKSYLEAKAAGYTKLDTLHRIEFVSAESVHQQHFARIEAQVKAQLQWLQQLIDASRTGMAEAAHSNLITHGEDLLDNLRSTFAQIDSEHRQLVEQLKREAESVARFSYLIVFTGTLASLLIFMVAILRLNFVANRSKRTEEVLKDSEVQYRTMIENSNDMIWTLAPDGRFTFINQQAADVTGRRIEDWLGKTFEPLVVEEDLPIVLEMHGKIMSGEKVHYEVHGKKADGGVLTLSVNASPIFKDGKVSGTISFASDITARKQMEKELRESEARYRRITEGLTDYQYTVRIENGRAVKTTQSPACVTVTGYTVEEFATNPNLWLQMVVPEDRERVREHVRQILAGNDGTPIEHRITRKDGEMRWISDTTILFRDAAGKLLSYDGVIKDITERKLAATALAESEMRLRTIIQSEPECVKTLDSNGALLDMNPAGLAMIEADSLEQVRGTKIVNIVAPDYRAAFIALNTRVFRGESGTLEFEIAGLKGTRRWLETYAVPLRNAEGTITSLLGITRDITERKQAESEIQRANRALATLSAVNHTLVHASDENTLLRAVCDAIVEQNGYRMAWVGYAQHDAAKSIKIMACAGQGKDYVDTMQLAWEETEHGMRPCGCAILSNTTQVCQDIAHDPHCLPWHDAALEHGYAASIALPLARMGGKVFGTLVVYSDEVNAFGPAEVELLEEMAGDMAFGVRSLQIRHERDMAQKKVQQQLVQLQDSLEDTVRAIATIVEMRDPYTSGHQVKVADLAVAIARQMGLPEEQVHALHLAGIVHDLGKIKIPAEILSKPGRITDIEFSLIKVHPQAGYDILKGIDFPWPIAQMVLQHHERLDGSGYPQGLKGDQIILEARILSVADVVEAICSHRPYRPGLGIDVALAEITRQRDTHYDPQAVDACLAVFREQGYRFK